MATMAPPGKATFWTNGLANQSSVHDVLMPWFTVYVLLVDDDVVMDW